MFEMEEYFTSDKDIDARARGKRKMHAASP
jgi:hypothetical protein